MKLASMIGGIISFLCLIVYFLALNDIGNDYVSPEILQNYSVETSLPNWTSCTLEWKALQAGFFPMFLFHVLYMISSITEAKRGQ